MARSANSPLRLLAPVALAVCALAFVYVVVSSQGRGGPSPRSGNAAGAPRASGPTAGSRTYTVRSGDTLAGIARTTGVSAERLQELNPRVDPQALVSGQRLKLRE